MTTQAPPAATTADPKPAAEAAAPKGAKPIPPSAEPAARGADGKFLPKDAKADPGGALRDSLATTADIAPIDDLASSLYESEEDRDRDRPVATLDGMVSEEKDKAPKLKVKTRETIIEKQLAKAAAAKDGAPAVERKADIVDPGAEDTGDAKVEPPAPIDPAAPAKTDKFVLATLLGDKVDEQFEFDTPEKAAQSFKTLRGMYKKENADRIALQSNARANFEAAEAWKKKAEALERGERPTSTTLSTPAGEAGGNGTSTTDLSPDDAVAASINWSEHDRIEALANEKYPNNPRLVARLMDTWKARETARAMRAQFDKRFESYEAPTRQRAELVKHGTEVAARMDALESATYDDGSPAYPEFADNDARQEIGTLLRARAAEGIDWKFLKTEKGLYETTVIWRDWRRRTGRPWSAANGTPVAAPPPPPSNGTSTATTTDAAGVESALRSLEGRNAGVMDGRRQPVRPTADSPAETIKRKIAESDQRTSLGYSR